jgi:hypothetical protein
LKPPNKSTPTSVEIRVYLLFQKQERSYGISGSYDRTATVALTAEGRGRCDLTPDGGVGIKLKLDITPDLVAATAVRMKSGEKAIAAAMREAGTGLKTAWRGQITSAGLRTRLANSIRQTYPKSRRKPEHGRARRVQDACHRRRARYWPADPLEERVLGR